MDRVTSKDGTSIAYERDVRGPALILVGGAIVDGSENAPLLSEADSFTVYSYARRGRGQSGDTPPYAVEREIEDLEALIAKAGGSAHVFGASSGGGLALEAAAAGLAIDRLAVYEVPYALNEDGPYWNRRDVPEVEELLAKGRRGHRVELLMRTVGSSEEDIEGARGTVLALPGSSRAHARLRCGLHGGRPPTQRPTRDDHTADPGDHQRGQPRLACRRAAGGLHGSAADAIAESILLAERRIIDGGGHMVDAKLVAPVLERFFGG